MTVTAEATTIRPFEIDPPEEQSRELRRRVEATRRPNYELLAFVAEPAAVGV